MASQRNRRRSKNKKQQSTSSQNNLEFIQSWELYSYIIGAIISLILFILMLIGVIPSG